MPSNSNSCFAVVLATLPPQAACAIDVAINERLAALTRKERRQALALRAASQVRAALGRAVCMTAAWTVQG